MFFRRALLTVIGFGLSLCLVAGAMGCFREDPGIVFLPFQQSNTSNATNTQLPESVSLPLQVSDTDLIAQCFASYDGNDLETDTGKEVTGVAALLVHNVGETMVLQARVNLEQNGMLYTFWITMLPPGESALVLDENATLYRKGTFTACYGKVICTDSYTSPFPALEITPGENDALILNNKGNTATSEFQIYYKSSYEGLFYLGGKAKCVAVKPLQPGEIRTIYPEFYVEKLCRILYVEKVFAND